MRNSFEQTAAQLVAVAKGLHARGWLLGTSGNLSAVVTSDPFRLAITPSGVDKGELRPEQVLLIDEHAQSINQSSKPSDESPLHITIAKERGAGAIVHTHSIWNTILSDSATDHDGLPIEGYEMLKGLSGVRTHLHREWLPIIDNSQDMPELASTITDVLGKHKDAHGFLLRRHGLYTWGRDLHEAKRHVEILEFLLETLGRTGEGKARSQI
jgi:methylthioribulose-1-phosphate dehydratase